MAEGKRETLTLSEQLDDQRTDRMILLETNLLVRRLALLRGTKTIEELEETMRIVDEPISILNLSSRTQQALIGNNIKTVRQLLLLTPEALIEKENIGRFARNEIIEVLTNHNLRLKESGQAHHTQISRSVQPSQPDNGSQSSQAVVEPRSEKPAITNSPPSEYKKGDIVRHPTKEDWGIGTVLSDSTGGLVNVVFNQAGKKTLSLEYVQLIKVSGAPIADLSVDQRTPPDPLSSGRIPCTNCGQPTQFGERAAPQRVALGWCDSCFKQSQRTFQDQVTGEKRYVDELRTIDGIKHRYYSPK